MPERRNRITTPGTWTIQKRRILLLLFAIYNFRSARRYREFERIWWRLVPDFRQYAYRNMANIWTARHRANHNEHDWAVIDRLEPNGPQYDAAELANFAAVDALVRAAAQHLGINLVRQEPANVTHTSLITGVPSVVAAVVAPSAGAAVVATSSTHAQTEGSGSRIAKAGSALQHPRIISATPSSATPSNSQTRLVLPGHDPNDGEVGGEGVGAPAGSVVVKSPTSRRDARATTHDQDTVEPLVRPQALSSHPAWTDGNDLILRALELPRRSRKYEVGTVRHNTGALWDRIRSLDGLSEVANDPVTYVERDEDDPRSRTIIITEEERAPWEEPADDEELEENQPVSIAGTRSRPPFEVDGIQVVNAHVPRKGNGGSKEDRGRRL